MRVYYKQVQLNPTQETDYNDLANKPKINGVDLEGDLSTEQIKITWHGTQAEFDALPSVDPYTFYIIDDGIPVGMQESYLNLSDKPSINGQVLTGNKVSSDLNMYTSDEVDNIIASMRAIKVVTALPAAPQVNTMYYVGPDSEGVYQVYLFDSLLNRIDLGPSVQKLYTAGNAIGINETTSTISVKYDGTSIRTNTANELYVPELMGSEGSGVNPIYLANGELKASTSTVGHSIKPVYLDNGTIKEVTHVTSGAYDRGVPYIAGGVMLTGNVIQMHQPADSDGTQWGNIALDATAGSVNLWNNNYNNKQKGAILTTNGDQMKGELYSSYNNTGRKMVINGAYYPSATKLVDIMNELRVSSGAMGSVQLTESFTDSHSGLTINNGWYYYLYLPHRTGGQNGVAAPDNTNYGVLLLHSLGTYGSFRVYLNGIDSTAGAATAEKIVVSKMIDSDYINKYAPINITNNGGALTDRQVTLLNGKVINVTADIANRGIHVWGTGVTSAQRIHQVMYVSTHNAKTTNDILIGYLFANSSAGFVLNGQQGPTPVDYASSINLGSSTTATFKPFTAASDISQFHVDIDWLRASSSSSNWWNGYGTIATLSSSGVVCRASVFINVRGSESGVLPFIQLPAQSTKHSEVFYSLDVYPASF